MENLTWHKVYKIHLAVMCTNFLSFESSSDIQVRAMATQNIIFTMFQTKAQIHTE